LLGTWSTSEATTVPGIMSTVSTMVGVCLVFYLSLQSVLLRLYASSGGFFFSINQTTSKSYSTHKHLSHPSANHRSQVNASHVPVLRLCVRISPTLTCPCHCLPASIDPSLAPALTSSLSFSLTLGIVY
jgi:hypothetical protein